MDKQQQIVEMAKDICRVKHICNDVCKPISACNALKYAERAIEAGYVKQREVAREIFEEIENLMREWFDFFRQDNDIRESCAIMAALSQISELKKKYTQ